MTTDPFAAPASYAATRPRRPRVAWPAPPAWLPFAAAGAGLVAAVAIPDRPPGLGTVLAIVAIAAALLPVVRASLRPADLVLGAPLVGLLAMFLLRDAEWLLMLDLLVIAALGTILLAGAATWTAFVTAGVTMWARLLPALPYVLRPLLGRARAAQRTGPVLRGSFLALGLVLLFGALFASADAAFASLAGRLVPSFDLLPAQVLVGVFTAALVGAGLLTHLRPLPAPALPEPLDRPRAEWAVPVLALDGLFAAFVGVQLAVLFGGNDHVLATSGLTYAQYARQGFFQLVAVAVLTLAVVAVVAGRVRLATPRERSLARLSLGALCLLTLVVLASAWRRLALYEAVYGLTRLRLFVHATIVGIALVLLLVLLAGARWRGAWLPRACAGVAAATLLALNVANPDALIARRAVERSRVGFEVDRYYLAGLSADAVPALRSLDVTRDECERLGRGESWLGWNLARSRARAACR
ncbi:MAG TPA: DUF4173 domain-containing protein [Mycobacteriales bacterium]|jgi:hypothetical protein|nr:DUF4173 domain-containing protein [Mycobacteriales bacterium]